MKKEELGNLAVELKAMEGTNCCQAVALALADETKMQKDDLRMIGAGFGSGMGTMDATCSALVGAGIIASLKTEGKSSKKFTSQILTRFRELSGAVACKDLKGRDTGVVLCPCDKCVYNAVAAYCETFGIE
ncbi:MAG: C_GCAxxG_C_C family protein [Salinivirgaceae bacterium]|nr:C_GCAxxG_C_C family protein [Salinivirgaceae bacterium]